MYTKNVLLLHSRDEKKYSHGNRNYANMEVLMRRKKIFQETDFDFMLGSRGHFGTLTLG